MHGLCGKSIFNALMMLLYSLFDSKLNLRCSVLLTHDIGSELLLTCLCLLLVSIPRQLQSLLKTLLECLCRGFALFHQGVFAFFNSVTVFIILCENILKVFKALVMFTISDQRNAMIFILETHLSLLYTGLALAFSRWNFMCNSFEFSFRVLVNLVLFVHDRRVV